MPGNVASSPVRWRSQCSPGAGSWGLGHTEQEQDHTCQGTKVSSHESGSRVLKCWQAASKKGKCYGSMVSATWRGVATNW